MFWGHFFPNAPLLKYPGNAPDSAGEHKGRLKPSVEETVLEREAAAAREIIKRANPV